METAPPTPDPTDHTGPSDYEGWDPTPDPVGEVDIPDATGSGTESSSTPGIAFEPAASPAPSDSDEVVALRERLAFYENFDSLIRDNIDRAGALMREIATKQGDAEVKLRANAKDFERKQIEERAGYRKVFASLLDEVSTIQQQVERLARQVSDALDDLELQLPAAGELSAIERGQAPGMSGLAAVTAPAGLPSGASSAAWVTHDDDLPSSAGKHATGSTHHIEQAPAGPQPSPSDAPLASDDIGIVEDAAENAEAVDVDPEVVADVLTEGTDADPAVADPAEDLPTGSPRLTDQSDLPEEFGLDNVSAPGAAAVVDEPYVEQSVGTEAETAEPVAPDGDLLDVHLTSAAESEGFFVDSAPELDGLDDTVIGESPLRAAAPSEIEEHDGGLDEEPAIDDAPEPRDVADATASQVVDEAESQPQPPYGSDAPLETGLGSHAAGVATGGLAEPPSKLRRFEPDATKPVWGSVPPAQHGEPARGPSSRVSAQADATTAQDTIVLVHGVPRATTALSLKRYLEGLEAVTAVEPREYAEGVLRLQVTGERAIRITDLSAWPDGSGLQEVQVREDLVEIRLPS